MLSGFFYISMKKSNFMISLIIFLICKKYWRWKKFGHFVVVACEKKALPNYSEPQKV